MGVLDLILDTKVFFLLIFTLIALIVAITLTFIEKKPKKETQTQENKIQYEDKILKIIKSQKHNQEKLAEINSLAKEFFINNLKLKQKEYDELNKEFEKLNKPELVKFSKIMIEVYYSGKLITTHEIEQLAELLILATKPQKQKITKTTLFNKIKKFISGEEKQENSSIQTIHKKDQNLVYTALIPETQKLQSPQLKKLNKEDIKKIEKKLEKKDYTIVRKGKDDEENHSFFIKHPHFKNLKENFKETQHHTKEIKSKIKQHKENTIKENIILEELTEDFESVKSKIQEAYKNILSKI